MVGVAPRPWGALTKALDSATCPLIFPGWWLQHGWLNEAISQSCTHTSQRTRIPSAQIRSLASLSYARPHPPFRLLAHSHSYSQSSSLHMMFLRPGYDAPRPTTGNVKSSSFKKQALSHRRNSPSAGYALHFKITLICSQIH